MMSDSAMQLHQGTGAAILAGGLSTRMGTNKALLRLHPGGPTLIETVVARLHEAGLPAPLLVTNTPDEYAFLGLPTLPDEVPGVGPLAGILTALLHSPYERVLVVACDMPALNPALLRYIAALPPGDDAIVPRWHSEGGTQHVEPLHTIYARSCIEPIRRRIQAGRLKASTLLADLQVYWLDEPELRRYDPTLRSFRNANTPSEWEALRGESSE